MIILNREKDFSLGADRPRLPQKAATERLLRV
jgi:hypothetical protein